MEKKRMPKGKYYWWISTNTFEVFFAQDTTYDDYDGQSDDRYKVGNYFNSFFEAVVAANKLKAVLKGADVINMPTEEEFYEFAPSTDKLGGFSLENRRQSFQDCWNWIKSKIVK